MQFEWDEAKRRANLAKHGLDFLDAVGLFAAPYMAERTRTVNGEERHLAVGVVQQEFVTVVFVYRNDRIRLISMRRSRRAERRRYQALHG